MPVDEFIRRFLIHVLPRGFQRIRFFGSLSNRKRKVTLATCRRLLSGPRADLLPDPAAYRTLRLPADRESIRRCPRCGKGEMAPTAFFNVAAQRRGAAVQDGIDCPVLLAGQSVALPVSGAACRRMPASSKTGRYKERYHFFAGPLRPSRSRGLWVALTKRGDT